MTKTYVITGATSGIGKALVESYKNEDVKLIMGDMLNMPIANDSCDIVYYSTCVRTKWRK